MAFGSTTSSETPAVNPPPSLSSPLPMLTAASFYMRPRIIPSNYTFPPLRMNTNHHHQYYNYLPDYFHANPMLQRVNHTENLTSPILNLGSSSSLSENLRNTPNLSNPNLYFGSYQSLRENLRSGPIFQLGSSPSRDENINMLSGHSGVSVNHVEALPSLGLGLGSSPNRGENIRSHALHENRSLISNSNQIENNEENNMLGLVKQVSGDEIEKNGEEIDEKGKSDICVNFPVKEKGFGSGDRVDDEGRDEEEEEKGEQEMELLDEDEAEELSLKTRNLRPRKLVTKPPNRSSNGNKRRPPRIRPPPTRESKPRQGKRTQGGMVASVQIRPSFAMHLSKKEIEEDFIKMTGEKPPKKPNKRPRIVQRQLDMSFPGLWLGPTVNVELYRVPDPPLKG